MSCDAPFGVPTLKDVLGVLQRAGLTKPVLNIYLWGSRVYGTAGPLSDWDFNVIYDDDSPKSGQTLSQRAWVTSDPETSFEVIEENVGDGKIINCTLIPFRHFLARARECRHDMLENLNSPPWCILIEKIHIPINEVLDIDVLRRTATWQSKRRFHVASGVLETQGLTAAKKSIFHSIRYLLFAKQIISHGKIVDFHEAIPVFNQIMNFDCSSDWSHYVETYEPQRKAVSQSLQSLRPFNDLRGPLDVERKFWRLVRERAPCNPLTPFSFVPDSTGHGIWGLVDAALQHGHTDRFDRFLMDNKITCIRSQSNPDLIFLRPNPFESASPETTNWFSSCPGGVLLHCDSNQRHIEPAAFCLEQVFRMCTSCSGGASASPFLPLTDAVPVSVYPFNGRWHVLTCWGPDSASFLTLANRSNRESGRASTLQDELWNRLVKDMLPDPTRCNICFCFSLHSSRLVTKNPIEAPVELVCGWDLSSCKVIPAADLLRLENLFPLKPFIQDSNLAHEDNNPFHCAGRVSITSGNILVDLSRDYVSIALGSDFSTIGHLNMLGDLDERQALNLIRIRADHIWLSRFPEWSDALQSISVLYDHMCDMMQATLSSVLALKGPQVSAQIAPLWYKPIIFAALKDRFLSIREYFAICDDKIFSTYWSKFISKAKISKQHVPK